MDNIALTTCPARLVIRETTLKGVLECACGQNVRAYREDLIHDQEARAVKR